MTVVLSIFIMLLILTVLVVVHEWGHYISARIFGVKVNEFSIFMGPKIFSRVGKKTGTVFSIRCLPLGGFCAMEGEETTEDGDSAFCNKPWWQRTIILLSGVFMNIVLAIVIITIVFMIYGYGTREVSRVNEFMPAGLMDINEGDSIIEYNDHSIFNPLDYNLVNYAVNLDDSTMTVKKADGEKEFFKIGRVVNEDEKNAFIVIKKVIDDVEKNVGIYTANWDTDYLEIKIVRDNAESQKYIFAKNADGKYYSSTTSYDSLGNIKTEETMLPYSEKDVKSILSSYSPYKNGFSFSDEKGNLFESLGNAVVYNASLVKSVFNSLKWLVTGRLGMDAMSGPIGLTTVVDDVVSADASIMARIVSLFEMAALISANLAAFNVLPIPGLDGGKLIFIIIELIRRGKKVPPEKEAVVSLIFLALLILFSIFIAGNDIIRIIRS